MFPDQIAELEKWLAVTGSAVEKIDALNALAWELRDRDPIRAHDLAQQSLKEIKEQAAAGKPYPKGNALALLTLGELSTRRETCGLALTYLLEAYQILESLPDSEIRADAAHSIGWAHFLMENYAESFEYLQTSLNLYRQTGFGEKEAAVLTSLGTVYSKTGRHTQAMEAFQKVLQVLDDKPASRGKGITFNNLSIAQIRIGNYKEALHNAQKGLRIMKDLKLRALEASLLETLSQAYFNLGDLSSAEEALQTSLVISREIGIISAEMEAVLTLSKVYQSQGRLEPACDLLNQALQLMDKRQLHIYRYKCHEMLAKIHEGRGNLPAALAHYRQYHSAVQQALAESARFRLENLKTLYQVEKIRKEAEILKLQNLTLEREIEDRRRDHSELEKLAVTDPLTGLFNRRHFFTLGEYELEKSQKSGGLFSMIMLDIDHFKRVNDTYAHAIGDLVLTAIAGLISEHSRKGDLCFRFGGEEFTILLPGIGIEKSVEIAERVRKAIDTTPIEVNAQAIAITASLGVTQAQPQDAGLTAVIARADQALYQAKSAGRNRVAVQMP